MSEGVTNGVVAMEAPDMQITMELMFVYKDQALREIIQKYGLLEKVLGPQVIDVRHEKTDLLKGLCRCHIPKEGLARMAMPILLLV